MTTNFILDVADVKGQWCIGYITNTTLIDDDEGVETVCYGLFLTRNEAREWAERLNGSTMIVPVYYPTHSRG